MANSTNQNIPQRISGAIFDLDGTILDTMEQWDTLGLRYLQDNKIEPKQDFLDRIGTMSLRESAQLFHDEYGVPLEVDRIIEDLVERLRNLYLKEAKAKPGAIETLRFLKRSGVDLAVATATTRELAVNGLRLVGGLDFFSEIFSCRDPHIKESKRSPKIYNLARKFLGSPLKETIVVEDALYALETAKKAGFFIVAIEDPSERTRKEQIQKLADVYVNNHFELHEWLQNNIRWE
ncbi:MAG: HAD family phosphatase [Thermoguttaceae bacterium]|nr:HAD family phosphatase [Thermoguttaceae bacterium]